VTEAAVNRWIITSNARENEFCAHCSLCWFSHGKRGFL